MACPPRAETGTESGGARCLKYAPAPEIFENQSGWNRGHESQDWASMLLRMYLRYFERNGYDVEQLALKEGEEAGIQSVNLSVSGPYAYGYLSCEMGVHRLVRISPFSAQGKRETSFAAVHVLAIDPCPIPAVWVVVFMRAIDPAPAPDLYAEDALLVERAKEPAPIPLAVATL